MDLDFGNTEQITDLISVPSGTYLCRVADVRERQTRNDDALWALRLVVAEGEFTGRDAAWDNLVFSNRGLNRVKLVFTALGLPADGKIEVSPADLLDKEAFVEVRPSEYLAPSGTMVRRNEVPYGGYRAMVTADTPAAEKAVKDDDLPF